VKTWFITGASSGLGRTMTESLLARGDRVAATVRRPGALDELIAKHGDRLRVLVVDLTDTARMRGEVDAAFAALGRIEVVVSNAAYGLFGAIEEVSDEQMERQIATNLIAPMQLVRACLPHLRRQGGGRIVQISSEGGQVIYPSFGVYHATKWGIEGFIETVAQEVAPFGIDCVIVEPGPTATNFGANLDLAQPIADYDGTPAGEARRVVTSGSFPITGDARHTVGAIIAAADEKRSPLRLVLGSAAYEHIEHALAERLEAVRKQKAIAHSADRHRSTASQNSAAVSASD
jgi:NAD(P)-dependent dehydrogenase (short-subunit alcohol dehydrogenase family)